MKKKTVADCECLWGELQSSSHTGHRGWLFDGTNQCCLLNHFVSWIYERQSKRMSTWTDISQSDKHQMNHILPKSSSDGYCKTIAVIHGCFFTGEMLILLYSFDADTVVYISFVGCVGVRCICVIFIYYQVRSTSEPVVVKIQFQYTRRKPLCIYLFCITFFFIYH